MYPSASGRTDACAGPDIPLLLGSDSSEARNGGSRRIKAPKPLLERSVSLTPSQSNVSNVEVLESTQRAPEDAAQAMKFVT